MVSIPYDIIASYFKSHEVVLFLGAAASFVGADEQIALPGGPRLAAILARNAAYPGLESDSLSKISQYVEDFPGGRDYLLHKFLSPLFYEIAGHYRSALMEFLTKLPQAMLPKLIITTNYDILIERTCEEQIGVPYLAVSYIGGESQFAGRFLCYESLKTSLDRSAILTSGELDERLLEIEEEKSAHVLIFKMHGTSRLKGESGSTIDSIVLTEGDYVNFLARDRIRKIPTKIVNILRENRLLFLGYSLEDWNFRVLLQRLSLIQKKKDYQPSQKRHWACVKEADEVEVKFWEQRGVNLYRYSLDTFLDQLYNCL